MINIAVFILLSVVVFCMFVVREWKIWFALPFVLGIFFIAIQPLPMVLGHPIDERYVQDMEGLLLGGRGKILMIRFKGWDDPILVRVHDEKQASEALERSKKRLTFVRIGKPRGKGSGTPGENGGAGSANGLRILGDGEQTMLTKPE